MNSDSPNTADIVERLNEEAIRTTGVASNLMARAAAEIAELRELVFESLYHLRLDDGAQAYHNKVRAALKDHRKAQAHDR